MRKGREGKEEGSMRDRAREKWLFEECPFWESVLRLAFPTVIGQIILVIYNLADTFFIDLTGETTETLYQLMLAAHASPKEFVSGKMHLPAYRAEFAADLKKSLRAGNHVSHAVDET